MSNRFRDLLRERHPNAQRWKAEGRGIVGTFCIYTPEEVLYAAGLIPVRVMGINEPPSRSDTHLQPFYCPLSRSCLDQALRGDYAYLDGLVTAYSCDTYRGIFQLWQRHAPLPYSYLLGMPSRVDLPEAHVLLVEEMAEWVTSLERAFQRPISPESLRQAIRTYNTNRALSRELYRLRQEEAPRLTGTEALEAILAGMVCPKEQHNALLELFLREVSDRLRPSSQLPRLMLVGSELDNPEIVGLIEAAGAMVVADDLCTGSRALWNDCPEGEADPLSSLASRYLNLIPCPTKYPIEGRYQHLLRLIEQFRVQGVVILQQMFCHPHELEYPYLQKVLRERQVPFVCIELDATYSAEEIQTQAEELIERID
ncbi:MAG: 2-hydroxyacyl-CoA dehydratase [Candidatus Tectomicrobia bacterium]|uniref:2-hydroxyacyl-CoA dehydratase n=1 Tax=Tectimicrobiota bacterium TaxID=2528274 RepID=A0A932CPZ0_UNCTE|nr:2-hydroxyacyl-CoA dehydratase [Candidatus Tectomicrobia bacterium]